MITKQQALEANYFHREGCSRTIGPHGGVHLHITELRRNGRTKTWKTQPKRWELPLKLGFRKCYRLTEQDAQTLHVPNECPLLGGCDGEGPHDLLERRRLPIPGGNIILCRLCYARQSDEARWDLSSLRGRREWEVWEQLEIVG